MNHYLASLIEGKPAHPDAPKFLIKLSMLEGVELHAGNDTQWFFKATDAGFKAVVDLLGPSYTVEIQPGPLVS